MGTPAAWERERNQKSARRIIGTGYIIAIAVIAVNNTVIVYVTDPNDMSVRVAALFKDNQIIARWII